MIHWRSWGGLLPLKKKRSGRASEPRYLIRYTRTIRRTG
jgi:hypothetical protein